MRFEYTNNPSAQVEASTIIGIVPEVVVIPIIITILLISVDSDILICDINDISE